VEILLLQHLLRKAIGYYRNYIRRSARQFVSIRFVANATAWLAAGVGGICCQRNHSRHHCRKSNSASLCHFTVCPCHPDTPRTTRTQLFAMAVAHPGRRTVDRFDIAPDAKEFFHQYLAKPYFAATVQAALPRRGSFYARLCCFAICGVAAGVHYFCVSMGRSVSFLMVSQSNASLSASCGSYYRYRNNPAHKKMADAFDRIYL